MSRPTPTTGDLLQQFLQAQSTQATIVNLIVTDNNNKDALVKNLTTQLQQAQKDLETLKANSTGNNNKHTTATASAAKSK